MRDAIAARVTKRLHDADTEIERLRAENKALVEALGNVSAFLATFEDDPRHNAAVNSMIAYLAKLHRKHAQPAE